VHRRRPLDFQSANESSAYGASDVFLIRTLGSHKQFLRLGDQIDLGGEKIEDFVSHQQSVETISPAENPARDNGNQTALFDFSSDV
jgi:hypothetical protein